MQEAVGNAVFPALLTVEVSFCPRQENYCVPPVYGVLSLAAYETTTAKTSACAVIQSGYIGSGKHGRMSEDTCVPHDKIK